MAFYLYTVVNKYKLISRKYKPIYSAKVHPHISGQRFCVVLVET